MNEYDNDTEMPDILPPTDDHIFKTLLTHPTAEPILMDVISSCIERKVVSVQIRNNEIPAMDTNEKSERLDVNCVIDGGDQVNVEMQASRIEDREKMNEHIGLKNKSIYYMTDLHSSQKSQGVEYWDLARTYQITFCAYTIFPRRKKFISRSALRDEDGELVSDQLNLIMVELSKLNNALKKSIDDMTSLEMWSIFLRCAPIPKYKKLIDAIINKKKEIKMANALLMEISRDEDERAKFMSRRKFETDTYNNLAAVEKRGIATGMARGRMEVARKLLKRGDSVDDVVGITGLDLNDVLKLKGEI